MHYDLNWEDVLLAERHRRRHIWTFKTKSATNKHYFKKPYQIGQQSTIFPYLFNSLIRCIEKFLNIFSCFVGHSYLKGR